jgi:YVTN family beta-propeller protein
MSLCYNPVNNKVYVASGDSDRVTVSDGTTDSVVGTATAGTGPYALCWSAPDNKVYCANYGSDDVTVIDCATDSAVASVEVGHTPYAIASNPAQCRVYVANQGGSSISVLRDSGSGIEESFKPKAIGHKLAATVVRSLPVGAVAFDAMGRRVANPRSGIFFVREGAGRREQGGVRVRKVVVQR